MPVSLYEQKLMCHFESPQTSKHSSAVHLLPRFETYISGIGIQYQGGVVQASSKRGKILGSSDSEGE